MHHVSRQRKEADERNIGRNEVFLDQVKRDKLEDLWVCSSGGERWRRKVSSATRNDTLPSLLAATKTKTKRTTKSPKRTHEPMRGNFHASSSLMLSASSFLR